MRTVKVAADLDATREAVLAELSPQSIIEYERTYDVDDVTETEDGWILTAVSPEQGIEMDLRFEERRNGLAYELVSGGPFEELHTTVLVRDDATDTPDTGIDDATPEMADGPVRVTMTSEFTFGGWFSPVVDWLASGDRQRELQRALAALAADAGADE